MRSGTWIVSGVMTMLTLGFATLPASGQTANGFSPTGGCGMLAYDANTDSNMVTVPGSVLAGSVTVTRLCDGPVFVSLTVELSASGDTYITPLLSATCVAPSVPGGCTVGSPAVNPVPNGGYLVGSFAVHYIPAQSRTAAGVFPSLVRGNWKFDANIVGNDVGVSGVIVFIEHRIWTVQSAGTLPVTPPGSSR